MGEEETVTAPPAIDVAARPAAEPDPAQARAAAQRRRRRALLLWSLPLTIPATLVALKLISLLVVNTWALSALLAGEYGTAADRFAPLGTANVVEQDRYHFNRGTALLMDGRAEEAEPFLRDALPLAPEERECDVRLNLAASLEAQGDAAADTSLLRALSLYTEAAEVLNVPQCADDEQNSEASERVQDKQEQAGGGEGEDPESSDGEQSDEQQPSDGDPQDGDGSESSPDQQDPSGGEDEADQAEQERQEAERQEQERLEQERLEQERLERLEQRNQDAERARERELEEYGDGPGLGRGGGGSNW